MGGTPPNDAGGHFGDESEVGGRPTEPFDLAQDSSPWYLKPWVLAIWGVLVIILIAVIIYGLNELARGGGGGNPAPTTSSTTASPTTTTATTTSSPAASSTIETTTTVTPTYTPPAHGTAPPTRQHPHRHWWTDLPTTRIPGFGPP